MSSSPSPTTSPRTRQQFEPGAYNASEDAVLSVIRRKSETVEITSFEQLAELAGLPVADAEKAARRLVSRGCIKVVPVWGQDIERAQIYAKRLCAHLWVDSMRRRLQHSKGIHRTVVASPLVAEPAYRQRRDSVVRHLRKYCLGNTFQHEAVSIRDMAKDFG